MAVCVWERETKVAAIPMCKCVRRTKPPSPFQAQPQPQSYSFLVLELLVPTGVPLFPLFMPFSPITFFSSFLFSFLLFLCVSKDYNPIIIPSQTTNFFFLSSLHSSPIITTFASSTTVLSFIIHYLILDIRVHQVKPRAYKDKFLGWSNLRIQSQILILMFNQ